MSELNWISHSARNATIVNIDGQDYILKDIARSGGANYYIHQKDSIIFIGYIVEVSEGLLYKAVVEVFDIDDPVAYDEQHDLIHSITCVEEYGIKRYTKAITAVENLMEKTLKEIT